MGEKYIKIIHWKTTCEKIATIKLNYLVVERPMRSLGGEENFEDAKHKLDFRQLCRHKFCWTLILESRMLRKTFSNQVKVHSTETRFKMCRCPARFGCWWPLHPSWQVAMACRFHRKKWWQILLLWLVNMSSKFIRLGTFTIQNGTQRLQLRALKFPCFQDQGKKEKDKKGKIMSSLSTRFCILLAVYTHLACLRKK